MKSFLNHKIQIRNLKNKITTNKISNKIILSKILNKITNKNKSNKALINRNSSNKIIHNKTKTKIKINKIINKTIILRKINNKLRAGGKKIVQKSPGKQINYKGESDICITEPSRKEKKSKSNIELNKSFDQPKNSDNAAYNKALDELNKAENQIKALQKVNKDLQKNNRDLQFKLEEKQVEKELSGYRTEDVNFSNYEEEFDLKKMVNGARDKNRSEDINIDYPGVQGIKDKYRELTQNMNMLEEQVKILLSNINCSNNKIKPQVTR